MANPLSAMAAGPGAMPVGNRLFALAPQPQMGDVKGNYIHSPLTSKNSLKIFALNI